MRPIATEARPVASAAACGVPPSGPQVRIAVASLRNGAIGAVTMALFYVAVVRGASGSWTHLADQARQDWYFLAAIVIGFGTQVALVTELRRRRHLGHSATVTGGVGAGASTAGMIACCAHHLADLLPIVGAASAAGFVTDYRVPFMLAGIVINVVAVIVAARSLRRLSARFERAMV